MLRSEAPRWISLDTSDGATGNKLAHRARVSLPDLEIGRQELPVRQFIDAQLGRNLNFYILQIRRTKRNFGGETEQGWIAGFGCAGAQVHRQFQFTEVGFRMIHDAELDFQMPGTLFVDAKAHEF